MLHCKNTATFLDCLEASPPQSDPYRHWLLRDVFAPDLCRSVVELPFPLPEVSYEAGTRDSNNGTRIFFGEDACARFGVCRDAVATMQDPKVRRRIEQICGIDLSDSHLRIEYAQERSGFWLEPHTDIAVKLFTMLIYLNEGPGSQDLGTDIYDARKNVVTRAPSRFNHGLMFIPAGDTWHGFSPRPFNGIRRSLIVNYVTDGWRARHEIAPKFR